VQSKKIIVSAPGVVELDIHIHIAVLGRVAPGKGSKNPNPARSESVNLFEVVPQDRQRIYHASIINPLPQKNNLANNPLLAESMSQREQEEALNEDRLTRAYPEKGAISYI
jgi:hypothetical protein